MINTKWKGKPIFFGRNETTLWRDFVFESLQINIKKSNEKAALNLRRSSLSLNKKIEKLDLHLPGSRYFSCKLFLLSRSNNLWNAKWHERLNTLMTYQNTGFLTEMVVKNTALFILDHVMSVITDMVNIDLPDLEGMIYRISCIACDLILHRPWQMS